MFGSGEETVGLAFSSFATPSLFPLTDMDIHQSFSIASSVIGAIVQGIETGHLARNVTIILPIQPVSDTVTHNTHILAEKLSCTHHL